uniref:Uncharacterized protein n=1 Tax=Oryza glumipatula TaxID=40148 RepID=A0A0D9YDJ5_9ORYZ
MACIPFSCLLEGAVDNLVISTAVFNNCRDVCYLRAVAVQGTLPCLQPNPARILALNSSLSHTPHSASDLNLVTFLLLRGTTMQGTKSAQPKKLILATTLLSNSPHCSGSPYPGCKLAEKHSASAAAPAPLLPPPATGAGSPPSAAGAGSASPAAAVAGSRKFLNPIAHEVVLKITSFGGCSGLVAAATTGGGVLASAAEGGGGAGRRWGLVSARGWQQLQSAAMRRLGGVGAARGVAAAAADLGARGGGARRRPGQGGDREEGAFLLNVLGSDSRTGGVVDAAASPQRSVFLIFLV